MNIRKKKMLLDFTAFCNNNLPPVAAQLFFTHILCLIIPNPGGVAGILLEATPKLNPKKGCA
jgi:hypothetical protein